MIGGLGFYIPSLTAERNKTLTSFYGLRGEDNRIKLAHTFREPTNWVDYCDQVDLNNCTVPNDDNNIFSRYPNTREEKDSYFVPDLYSGHFRVTDRNNCTANPQNCTGHIVASTCDWTTYVDSQLHWNKIGLSSAGPEAPNNGYCHAHMVQIWRAANATKSDVFMWWWTPDLLVEEFGDSADYEFQRVTLPTPTEECLRYRGKELNEKRCSANIDDRIGEEIGSCDYAVVPVKKVISRGLLTASLANGEDALQSPAYTFLKQIYMPEYSLTNILRQWTRLKIEDSNADAARDSVCEWIHDNLDELVRYSPRGFPRERESKSYSALSYAGYALGSIAIILAVMTAMLTYIWRGNQVLKAAQLNVLSSMIVGYLFTGVSAILFAVVETSDFICSLQQWTLRLGYSLELVPILIKVSSINRLGREARLFRRASIDRNRFKKFLSTTIVILVTYLVIWTVVDMPQRDDVLTVIEGDITTVALYAGCASRSVVWGIMALGWDSLLLLSATILAYQSREIIQQLNESHWLAFLVYSHSVFLMIRLVVDILVFSGMVASPLSSKIVAIILSLETIVAISIYFVPKFVMIKNKDDIRAIQVQIRGKNSSGVRPRRSFITGVKIPDGGIPNLIKARGDGNVDVSALRSRVSSFNCQELPNSLSHLKEDDLEDDYEKKPSFISDADDDDNGDESLSFSSKKLPAKFSDANAQMDSTVSPNRKIEEFEAFEETFFDHDLEIEKLKDELRKRNEEIDLLQKKNYEYSRRQGRFSRSVSFAPSDDNPKNPQDVIDRKLSSNFH